MDLVSTLVAEGTARADRKTPQQNAAFSAQC
jgi:hypothetical protein